MATPQLGVVARPTDVNRQPTRAGDDLADAADALRGFNPTLRDIAAKRRKKFEDEQAVVGSLDALTKAETYRDAVKNGTLERGNNPVFRQARKEQIGRNTGYAIAQTIEEQYASWEGRNSEDPDGTAIQDFIGGIVKEQTKGISDPEILAGLQPALATTVNNLLVESRSERRKNLETKYADGVAIELSNTIDVLTKSPEGITPDGWNMAMYEIKEEAKMVGFPLADLDLAVQTAVIAKAELEQDLSLLDILDIPRPDGTPAISAKPAAQLLLASTRDSILSSIYKTDSAKAAAEREAVDTGAKLWDKRLVDALYGEQATGITKELRSQITVDLGSEEAAKILSRFESISDNSNTVGFDTEADLNEANRLEIAGDRAGIERMVMDGRIPNNLRRSYLQGVDNQAATGVSRGRETTRFNERGDTSSSKEAETQALIDAANAARESKANPGKKGDTPADKDRSSRAAKIEQASPTLFNGIAANSATPYTSWLKDRAKVVGWDKARAEFDDRYKAPGVSLSLLPQDTE